MKYEYYITPIGKPRMTQRDKWKKRPIVQRYYHFKDLIRLHNVTIPNYGANIIFILPFPKSWSKKKCKAMEGKPHQEKPDLDNILKALLDSAFMEGDDKKVYDIACAKYWGKYGKIIVHC